MEELKDYRCCRCKRLLFKFSEGKEGAARAALARPDKENCRIEIQCRCGKKNNFDREFAGSLKY